MASVSEIFTKAKDHLRAIAGDSVAIIKKAQDKTTEAINNIDIPKQDISPLVKATRDVEKAIKDKVNPDAIAISNPEAITGDLKAGLTDIVATLKTEIKNFDKEVVIKNDLSQLASLFKSNSDKKSILSALKKIEDKITEPEIQDYSVLLIELVRLADSDKTELLLTEILAKKYNVNFPSIMPVELDPRLVDDNRVRTILPDDQVDRMTSIATANSGPIVDAINNGSAVDANNSTTTPLGIAGVFTGTATDILSYSAISILVYSDEASATKGLSVEFSVTGTDWHEGESYTITAGSTKFFTPPAQSKYYRIKYTNGATAQTDFHLHAVLKRNSIKWSSHNIDDAIKDQDDAELTKSVITGKRTDGIYDNVSLTNGANMKVSLEEFDSSFIDNPLPITSHELLVGEGLVTGQSVVHKFGQNTALNTSTYEDIWDGGGVYTYPANGTAPITNVESTSASDTFDLEVQGLDINGDLTVQTVTLTGTTLVTLPTPLWRVFRMKNVGTADNVGIISADNAGTTVTYAIIQIGNNQTLMALYTIPLGKTGYLYQGTNSLVGLIRTYSVSGRMWVRPSGGVFQLKKTFGLQADGTSFINITNIIPAKMPALTDIRVDAISSAANSGLNTTFEILLIDD